MKYVVVMGGVISGLGKGVTASSIGVVLKACGLRVTSIKIGTYWSTPSNQRAANSSFSLFPIYVCDQKAHEAILKVLNLGSVAGEPNLEEWTARADLYDTLQETVRIAMVGKYTGVSDTYLSVMKVRRMDPYGVCFLQSIISLISFVQHIS
ncbi:hypothetical protein OsI_21045 [Oryza sativa Indica Group]|uniref:CTP synthase N-terminal domain-containing protein n=1 Tax=Oryza sativa subsp. indica TaxID=39946 RepID=A2Y7M8_ORYSI|nr:hypothetical protein OsI_21045 [Oryza sativa Indica Group]